MPIPVITVAQMREWEKVTWASGVKEDAVMRQAGQAVAQMAERLTTPGDFVLFLAGKGHNGDDTAYAYDSITGRQRELLRIIDPEISGREIEPFLQRKPALIVDGLFGIGLNRPLSGAWMNLIQQINEANAPILAVDIPSGLSGDTGLPLDVAIRAHWTLTLGAVKQGLIKTTAAPFVGRLEVAEEIGLLAYPFTPEINCTVGRDFRGFPAWRPVMGHKGTFGHLLIVAGSLGYHGAAVLAARGAQRAQPGLITVFTPEQVYSPIAAQLAAVMVHPISGELKPPDNCSAVLIGPGLAAAPLPEQIQRAARRLWQDSPLPVIVDASALGWLPAGPASKDALRVITPHPGEAARMLQSTTTKVQGDRSQAVRELSHRFGGCYVVLKGHQTLIGQEKSELFINSSGNPFLAQGGAGDLLAGYIGGLLAQPQLQRDPMLTLRFAVWQHGAAADKLLTAAPGFTVEDLASVLGSIRG
jgi:ADP-dependent NAD(P)H-hydrate dehydratase / NAD(P)H-hydrate epimerase